MTRRIRGSTTVSVDVDIDFQDVLPEIPDKTLTEECAARGISVGGKSEEDAEVWADFADDLRGAVATGDRMHMEVLIVRMMLLARLPRVKIPHPA